MAPIPVARLLLRANLAGGAAVVALLAVSILAHPASPRLSPRGGETARDGGSLPASPSGEHALVGAGTMPAAAGVDRASRTVLLVAEVALACELMKSAAGEFPPSASGEEMNEGAEALYAALSAAGYLGRIVPDAPIGDTDRDGKWEIVDAFGNPIVYFRNDRYGAPARYLISGREIMTTPQISSRTGEYHACGFVQVWSTGPDGENQNGSGDDITSWRIRD